MTGSQRSPEFDSSEEVGRVAAALRTAIRLSGVSNRQIERELNISTGYLTRILAGQIELRMTLVLSICRIIDFPVGNFFAALFPPGQESEAKNRLSKGLTQLYPGPVQRRDLKTLIQELREDLDHLEALLGEADREPMTGRP